MRTRVLVLLAALAGCGGCSAGGAEEPGGAAATITETVTVTAAGTGAGGEDDGGGQDGGGDPDGGDVFAAIPDVVRRVEPSVVSVTTNGGEGSGVIWSEDGTIVTNAHVVEGASRVSVTLASGASFPARIAASATRFDLAVLRIEREGLPAAAFREDLPDVGELVIAMGNPLGFEESVTAGIISGRHRSIPSGGRTPALVDLLQTDAAISPGNSGGALVDAEGRVVGINVAYLPPQQTGAVALGFAIPGATVVRVVRQLLERGRAEVAVLGIVPVQVTPELARQFGLEAEYGAGVQELSSGGGAERAGIRAGDVIVSLDGRRIETVEDLYAELNRRRPGERVAVGVVRDGDRRTFDVTLGGSGG